MVFRGYTDHDVFWGLVSVARETLTVFATQKKVTTQVPSQAVFAALLHSSAPTETSQNALICVSTGIAEVSRMLKMPRKPWFHAAPRVPE